MKENSSQGRPPRSRRRLITIAALVLAVVLACLTIRGMGVEGFVLWVIILFAGYWLLFNILLWLLGRLTKRP